ncbi:MAG: hypothetical protein F8N39_07225 [Clostridiaceae bacterium]|nr:hypothetical protein [Clostridiaceae bacterium]
MNYFSDTQRERTSADWVWSEILEEMLLLYYPPFFAETEEELEDQSVILLRAYVEDLSEFRLDTLRKAWRTVRRGHKTPRWPTLEVIRDACLDLEAPPPDQSIKGVRASQYCREEEFWRTGFWMDSWGPRPVRAEVEAARHERVMARFREGASPQFEAVIDSTVKRLRDGESAEKLLAQTIASSAPMPLAPGERMSSREADWRRRQSLDAERDQDRRRDTEIGETEAA